MRFKKIYIEITNFCNLNCSFCKESIRKKNFMCKKDFKTIIEKISSFTKFVYLHVLGEPFLHNDLQDFILICKENNIKVNLTTNGSLLSSEKNKVLNSEITNIHQINISLHSEYKKILSKEKYLEDVISFIKDSNNSFFINLRLWNENENYLSDENIGIIKKLYSSFNIQREIKSTYSRNKSIIFLEKAFIHVDKIFTWPNINQEEIFFRGKCYGLNNQIGILVDGTVIPCCLDGDGIINLGNIFEKDLEEIITSVRSTEILNGFKNQKPIEKLCRTCGFAVRNNLSV